MSQALSNQDAYAVIARKDLAWDGRLFVGVKTTGIFCRPGCTARLPKFENCAFYDSASAALAAGLRACKRCHPAKAPGAKRQGAQSEQAAAVFLFAPASQGVTAAIVRVTRATG